MSNKYGNKFLKKLNSIFDDYFLIIVTPRIHALNIYRFYIILLFTSNSNFQKKIVIQFDGIVLTVLYCIQLL